MQEARKLRSLGTCLLGLQYFDGRRNLPRGNKNEAYYDMEGSCAALNDKGLCIFHETREIPKSCSDLTPGGEHCLEIRNEQSLGPLKH